jgi:hypothetical protein
MFQNISWKQEPKFALCSWTYLGYQNQVYFIEKMNVPKAFFCILKNDIALGLQIINFRM